MSRRTRRTAALAAVLFGGLIHTATANAAYISSNSGCANLRFQPTTNSGTFGCFGNGTTLAVHCYKDNQWAYGNYWTNRWFHISVPGPVNHLAYIHASLLAAQPVVRRCPY